MNELQIFNNEEFGAIRTAEINDSIWFVGKDVANALGYANTKDAIANHVDDDDKLMGSENATPSITDSMGREQHPVFINESGVYALVFGSKLPSAKRFKHWVTSEVLPSIRKTSGYQLPQTYAEALRAYADQVEEAQRLALENKELAPKAEFYDAVTDSKDAIPMAEVAKVLDMGIGRNKLFEFLRVRKVLQPDNVPYQKYIDNGCFRVVEQKFDRGCGEVGINIKTLVFQKGVDYIRRLILEDLES